jgi:protein-tyrosine phosphatase
VSPTEGGGAVVAGERRVPFENVTNFRDLGGYQASDGRRVRWGRVFRADALHKFSHIDLAAFDRLGFRLVVDLRGDVERENQPNPMPSLHRPVMTRPQGEPAGPPDRSAMTVRGDGEQWLVELYLGLLERSGPALGDVLTILADDEQLPAVFHCAGGKDRTGMIAVLLLLLLGVTREDVLDDYELTSQYRTLEHQQAPLANLLASGMSPEAAAGVLGAPRHAMAAALDILDERYGGVEAYLTGPGAMSETTISALRSHLLS